MRKKVWIKMNDLVLVSLRDFEDSKADIIYKYDLDEVNYLKKEKEIPENVNIHDDVEEKKDIGIDFVEGSDESDEEEEVAKPEINFDDI
jgi:translation initiation factor 1A